MGRVMTVSEDRQTTLDETMRHNRELQRNVDYDREELIRSDLKAQGLEKDLQQARQQIHDDRAAYVKEKLQLQTSHAQEGDNSTEVSVTSANHMREQHAAELSNQASQFRNDAKHTEQEHLAFVGTLEDRIVGLRKDKANLEQELFQDGKDTVARVEMARSHAEELGLEDAARARDAEYKAEALECELNKTNAELGAALHEIDDAEVKLTQIGFEAVNPELINQVEFLRSPLRVAVS